MKIPEHVGKIQWEKKMKNATFPFVFEVQRSVGCWGAREHPILNGIWQMFPQLHRDRTVGRYSDSSIFILCFCYCCCCGEFIVFRPIPSGTLSFCCWPLLKNLFIFRSLSIYRGGLWCILPCLYVYVSWFRNGYSRIGMDGRSQKCWRRMRKEWGKYSVLVLLICPYFVWSVSEEVRQPHHRRR